MAYPFDQNIEKKIYNVTFLQSAIVTVIYDDSKESYDIFKRYFEGCFEMPLTSERYDLKNADAIRLASNDAGIKIKFSKRFIEIGVNGQNYHSFEDSLLPLLSSFDKMLKEIEASQYKINIEKIDIWPYESTDKITKNQLKEAILSENLIDSLRDQDFKIFNDDENRDSLVIKTKVYDQSNVGPENLVGLILDSSASHEGKSSSDDFITVAKRLNNVLYQAYHWAVTTDVIKAMTSDI